MGHGEEKSDNIQKRNIRQAKRVHLARPRREARGAAFTFFRTSKVGEETHPAGCVSGRTPPPPRRAPCSRLTGQG